MPGHGLLLSLLAAWLVAVLLHLRDGGPLDTVFRVATVSLGLLELAFLAATLYRLRRRPVESRTGSAAIRFGPSLAGGALLGAALWALASSEPRVRLGDAIVYPMVMLAFVLALGLLVYLGRRFRPDRAGAPGRWYLGAAMVIVALTLAGWWLARTGALGPAPGRPVMLAWLQAMATVALCLGIVRLTQAARTDR